MKATRLTESVREDLGVCVLVTFWLGQDGRAWMFHAGKPCSQTQGLLELDLPWVSSPLVCLGICGAASLVWQCLATVAAGFGPSPCQVLAHRLELVRQQERCPQDFAWEDMPAAHPHPTACRGVGQLRPSPPASKPLLESAWIFFFH